jgi:hypothetical protein
MSMVRRGAAFAVIGLVAGLLASSPARSADKDDDKAVAAAQKVVLEFLPKKDDKDMAKKIAKDHSIEYVMRAVFKPRDKGGIGIGEKDPPTGMKDSIELAIIDIATSKKASPIPADVLAKNNGDLVKMAELVQALAEINTFYKPDKAKPKKDPKDWERLNNDMKAASKDLLDAIKAKNGKMVGEAAKKLNASCTECHSIFRDS